MRECFSEMFVQDPVGSPLKRCRKKMRNRPPNRRSQHNSAVVPLHPAVNPSSPEVQSLSPGKSCPVTELKCVIHLFVIYQPSALLPPMTLFTVSARTTLSWLFVALTLSTSPISVSSERYSMLIKLENQAAADGF